MGSETAELDEGVEEALWASGAVMHGYILALAAAHKLTPGRHRRKLWALIVGSSIVGVVFSVLFLVADVEPTSESGEREVQDQ